MNNNIQRVTTTAKLALYYGVDTRTLFSMIEPYNELNAELESYLSKAKKKGSKILPPALTDKIIQQLGEP